MEKVSKKSAPLLEDQKIMMVEFMQQHPQLISGKFDSNFTYKKASELWEELTVMLNAIPGAKKDWKNWRKTWHDMRTRAKGRQSKINRYTRGTGGGPASQDTLNSIDSKIVALIGDVAISGHTEVAESQVLHINTDLSEFGTNEISVDMVKEVETVPIIFANDKEETVPIVITNDTNNTIIDSEQTNAKDLSANKTPVKRRIATQRLHRTVTATEKLAAQCEKKSMIKEEYYREKINIMKKELLIKERIAKALEDIASKIK